MKRAIFLMLLLANLGLFAWYRWYLQPGEKAPAPAPALTAKPLQLMSELTPAEKKALATQAAPAATVPMLATVAPAPATAAPSIVSQTCASYGPFPSADAAGQALARLKAAGLTGSQHLVPGKAKLGYWVYLPPFGSRKEADAASNLLKKRGVTDIYVVADEANRNAISLGVFSQKDGAVQRQKEIRKLGYKPQMAERFRDEARYWIDAKGAEAALPQADVFKDLADEAVPVGRSTSACGG